MARKKGKLSNLKLNQLSQKEQETAKGGFYIVPNRKIITISSTKLIGEELIDIRRPTPIASNNQKGN